MGREKMGIGVGVMRAGRGGGERMGMSSIVFVSLL